MNYKTPGVYVEEISLLPPSVAQVATAIPGFVGYTEKAVGSAGEDVTGQPVRIKSMLEFRTHFGGPAAQPFTVTISDNSPFTIEGIELTDGTQPYLLYQSMEMFFANGGGPCHVVSVGGFSGSPSLDESDDYKELKGGLDALRKVDEVTLLVIPEAVRLSDANYYTLCQDMLVQAGELQDRFAVHDVKTGDADAVKDYRSGVGTSYLNYGAAYYPYLQTTLPHAVAANEILFKQATSSNLINGLSLQNAQDLALVKREALLALAVITASASANLEPLKLAFDNVVGKAQVILVAAKRLSKQWDDPGGNASLITQENLINAAISAAKPLKQDYIDEIGNLKSAIDGLSQLAEDVIKGIADVDDVSEIDISKLLGLVSDQFIRTIYRLIEEPKQVLPAAAAVVGLYAMVDSTRGVWKAPANVSLRYVSRPEVLITHDEQRDLNVHTTGKSINAIRSFRGKGTLIWGARTLAGNDNEWRYVPVRRFYNMVEESVKKASESFVFEPNSANTWIKVRAMIENYLTTLWRQGALMGATTDEAFFVKIGLGETMSAQDVLEGRMIVEIGMAAVRPAEFIILRFSHFMQEN